MSGQQQTSHAAIQAVLDTSTPSQEDLLGAVRLMPAARRETDGLECALLERLMDQPGTTWEQVANHLETSGDALRVRYRRLGGTRSWPSGPRTGQ